jgi:serine/alanine adding enzyme
MNGDLVVRSFAGPPPGWDEFVTSAEHASFCHLAGWPELIVEMMGHRCSCHVAVDHDGRWQGLLPLVHVDSPLVGHFLVSMPFLNYGGPLGTPEAQRRLVEAAVDEAKRSGAVLLELRSRHSVPCGLQPAHRKVTMVLELGDSVEVLWAKGIPASRRRQIRRAQNAGMEIRLGPDQVGSFYHVFTRNMRHLGTPVLPLGWFERLAQTFRDIVLFGTVYSGTRPVAGGCGFLWRGEFELTWVSSLPEERGSYPNMLLYWSFMEEMVRRGARTFNFGRSTPGGMTHQFKSQWGSKEEALPWPQWSARGYTTTPSPEQSLFRIATAVWRRTPLIVTNRLGPVLARHLP